MPLVYDRVVVVAAYVCESLARWFILFLELIMSASPQIATYKQLPRGRTSCVRVVGDSGVGYYAVCRTLTRHKRRGAARALRGIGQCIKSKTDKDLHTLAHPCTSVNTDASFVIALSFLRVSDHKHNFTFYSRQ